MRARIIGGLFVALVVGACQSGGGATPPSTRPPSAAPLATVTPTLTASPTSTPGPSPTRRPCILDSGDWRSEMTEGRCTVISFNPPFTFNAPSDWRWSGYKDIGGFFWPGDTIPDDGDPLNVTYYRYGGEVGRKGCEADNGRQRIDTAAELVAWLREVPGLTATVEARQIGGRDAWLVSLRADGKLPCTEKGEPVAQLWSFEDGPDDLFALGKAGVYRVYVIDSPTGVVMMAVQYWHLKNTDAYFEAADRLVSSITFDSN